VVEVRLRRQRRKIFYNAGSHKNDVMAVSSVLLVCTKEVR